MSYPIIYLFIFTFLWLLYKWLLHSTGKFGINRIFLLSIPLVALVTPYINFDTATAGITNFTLPEIKAGIDAYSAPYEASINWTHTIWKLGMLTCAVWFLFRLTKTIMHKPNTEGYTFWKNIYVNDSLHQTIASSVLKHETVHAKYLHTLDIIVLEILRIVFWWNPLMHLLIRDAKLNHEFQADFYASQGDSNYPTILVAQHFKIDPTLLGHSFYTSNLKKRLIMIKTPKPVRFAWKYILFSALTIGAVTVVSSQEIADNISKTTISTDIGDVDQQAEFVGGTEKLGAYFNTTIRYPKSAKKDGIEGKVMVSFVVKKDGSIDEVIIKRGINEEIDAEALRAVQEMPKWQPATKDGKVVASRLILPISFKLS